MLPQPPPFEREYEFPYTKHLTYLNHASHIPLPTSALKAMLFLYDELREGVVDAKRHFVVNDMCRQAIAELIHTKPEQIALTHNTGEGINTVIWGLPWQSGDEILMPAHEFPAAVYPVLNLAEQKGLLVRFVPEPWTLSQLENQIREKTRGLIFSWADFATGEQRPLVEIGEFARKNNLLSLVDATQALGQLSLDLTQEPVDAISCGAQKWLAGPMGAGFLWISTRWLTNLKPPYFYWLGVNRSLDFEDLNQYNLPRFNNAKRYESGTFHHGDIYAFTGSLQLLLSIGAKKMEKHTQALADLICQQAQARSISVNLPQGAKGSAIVSLAPPHAEQIKKLLEQNRIITSLRAGCIRVSPYFYNTPDDIHNLFATIDKVL